MARSSVRDRGWSHGKESVSFCVFVGSHLNHPWPGTGALLGDPLPLLRPGSVEPHPHQLFSIHESLALRDDGGSVDGGGGLGGLGGGCGCDACHQRVRQELDVQRA